jgi:hypothetical protein
MVLETLHGKLKIEQHEPHWKQGAMKINICDESIWMI